MTRKKKQTIDYHIEEAYGILHVEYQSSYTSDVSIPEQVLTLGESGFKTEGDAVEYMEEEMKKWDNRDKDDWRVSPPSTFYVVKQYQIRKDWS